MPKTPCLFAPADDRIALGTTAGGIVLAVCRCTLKPILAATPARSISLATPETVNGAPGNENEGRLGLALSKSQRPQLIPEQSESYTVPPSAANSDIPIKQLSPNTLGQIDGGKTDYFLREDCLTVCIGPGEATKVGAIALAHAGDEE